MRRVLPAPGGAVAREGARTDELHEADLDQLYGSNRSRRAGRPTVGVCMISSLDGSTVVDGRSGALGNDSDAAVFAALRRAADVIVVGAATVRAERYRAPRRAGQRVGVVTATGDVDLASGLFTSGSGFLIMPEDGPTPLSRSVDVVRAGAGRVDLALALARLDDLMAPPTFVQVEGGARLNGALLDAGCIDEIHLTVAPLLAGGSGSRVTHGASDAVIGLRLAHVLTDDDGYLFTRWVRPQ